MKALSIQQPWAWLICAGHKPVENRSWATGYRGPLLIHAGKTHDLDGEEWVRRTFPGISLPRAFYYGGIIGRADLTDCVARLQGEDPLAHLNAWQREWFFGPFGFLLSAAEPLPFRAIRGQLGLFEVPDA